MFCDEKNEIELSAFTMQATVDQVLNHFYAIGLTLVPSI
ncbi:MAG: hypothetical protein ACI86M_001748 [Saprospiraceae bacterium]|jgi:hypothetical protein